MLVLECLIGLHRTVQLQLLRITGWGIDLDYCDIEWFALEMNRDYSVVFEIASKYCILDSFVIHIYNKYIIIFTIFHAGLTKRRGIGYQIANIRWIIEKAREFRENI